MEAMQEGYDGGGLGLLLRGIHFDDFNYRGDLPILSGIAHTEAALQRLEDYMTSHGYELKYDHEFAMTPGLIEAKDREKYIIRVYKEPVGADTSPEATEQRHMQVRLDLRKTSSLHGWGAS